MSYPALRQAPARLIVPAQKFDAITTATTSLQTDPSRGLYFSAAGSVGFTDRANTSTYAVPVVAGGILPVQITRLSSISAGLTVYALR